MKIILSVLTHKDNISIIIQTIICLFNTKYVHTIKNNAQNISGVVLLHAIMIGEEKLNKYNQKNKIGYFSSSFLNIKNKIEQKIKYEIIETAIIASIIQSHIL
jgi:hypothetical protein